MVVLEYPKGQKTTPKNANQANAWANRGGNRKRFICISRRMCPFLASDDAPLELQLPQPSKNAANEPLRIVCHQVATHLTACAMGTARRSVPCRPGTRSIAGRRP